jgi:hypothetical protein
VHSKLALRGFCVRRIARIALLYRLSVCCLRIKCLREGPARNLDEFVVELVTIIAWVTFNARLPRTSSAFDHFAPQPICTPPWWLVISNTAPRRSSLWPSIILATSRCRSEKSCCKRRMMKTLPQSQATHHVPSTYTLEPKPFISQSLLSYNAHKECQISKTGLGGSRLRFVAPSY